MPNEVDIYGGVDPSEVPLYTQADAAHHLDLPRSTVGYWVCGRRQESQPIISPRTSEELSFLHLVELFTLKALRRSERLPCIRKAINDLKYQGIKRPLLRGIETWSTKFPLENGQEEALCRVERDVDSVPRKLFPVVEDSINEKPVVINPQVSFGKPTVQGTGIHTAVIASRVDAQETVDAIAKDYRIDPSLVTDTLLYEKTV
ncbi:MAG: DUF433 domain-containing protein [Truepera sp.]|nr:DUF433 domain-containing protein [Truepera sp.]